MGENSHLCGGDKFNYNMDMKYHIWTEGCQMNVADSQRTASALEQIGYQPASRSWWKNPLNLNDLQIDDPYNTYIYPGLPPGPIASPGPASIRSAANPTPTDYYFFVLDCEANTGEHIFSTTFEEHLEYARACQ